jgi:hypothetical protein
VKSKSQSPVNGILFASLNAYVEEEGAVLPADIESIRGLLAAETSN